MTQVSVEHGKIIGLSVYQTAHTHLSLPKDRVYYVQKISVISDQPYGLT